MEIEPSLGTDRTVPQKASNRPAPNRQALFSTDVLDIASQVSEQKGLSIFHEVLTKSSPEEIKNLRETPPKEYETSRTKGIEAIVQKTELGFFKKFLFRRALRRMIPEDPKKATIDPELLVQTFKPHDEQNVELSERVSPEKVALAGLKSALEWIAIDAPKSEKNTPTSPKARKSLSDPTAFGEIELHNQSKSQGANLLLERLNKNTSGTLTEEEQNWLKTKVGIQELKDIFVPPGIAALLEPLDLDPLVYTFAAYVLTSQYKKLPLSFRFILESTGSDTAMVNFLMPPFLRTAQPTMQFIETPGLVHRAHLKDTRRSSTEQAILNIQYEFEQKQKQGLFSKARLLKSAEILKNTPITNQTTRDEALNKLVDFILPAQKNIARRYLLRAIFERALPEINPNAIAQIIANHSPGSPEPEMPVEIKSALEGLPAQLKISFEQALETPANIPKQLAQLLMQAF
ncbi:MAG: hypothetical protein WCK49_03270 [Myxococcaceae bacterium]